MDYNVTSDKNKAYSFIQKQKKYATEGNRLAYHFTVQGHFKNLMVIVTVICDRKVQLIINHLKNGFTNERKCYR